MNTDEGKPVIANTDADESETSDGTLGRMAGTGSGAIAGGLLGEVIGGPPGALAGAVIGGVLGAAGGDAAHHIGDEVDVTDALDDTGTGGAAIAPAGIAGIAATDTIYAVPIATDIYPPPDAEEADADGDDDRDTDGDASSRHREHSP